MKILLIEPYSYVNSSRWLVPVGLPYLAAVLQQHGHEVHGINVNYIGMSPEASMDHILGMIREEKYDVVGMGGLCFSFIYQRELFDRIRKLKDRPVLVSGGNMFTSEPELCMREYGVDFGIHGEGEITVPRLLEAIEAGRSPAFINGVFYSDGGAIRSTGIPGDIVMDLDTIPLPAYEVFYSEEVIRGQLELSIYGSRSCPFSCTFCYHPVGSRYRRRSVQNVIEEFKIMYERYGADSYFLADELFFVGNDWIRDFCDELDKLPFVRSWNCQTRATHVDPALLRRVKQSKCIHVRVGIESGSQTILDSMNKKTTVEDNRRAINNIRDAGLMMDGGIIMGDFAETRETIEETVAFCKETNLVANQSIIFITPLPGATIWDRCLDAGLIKDPVEHLERLTQPAKLLVNMTSMDDRELLGLQEWAAEELFTHFIDNCRGEMMSIEELTPTSSHFTIRCPHCAATQLYGLDGFRLEAHYYCENCKRPVFPSPLDIPHLRDSSKRFREWLETLPESDIPDLLVTPSCLDFIRLKSLGAFPRDRVLAFFDQSGPKTQIDYFGKPVLPRNRENIEQFVLAGKTDTLVIVSAGYCDPIFREVSAWEIPGLNIIPIFDSST